MYKNTYFWRKFWILDLKFKNSLKISVQGGPKLGLGEALPRISVLC